MIVKRIKTPCVGICSTGIGDDVCRGCKRFGHEVINWNGYTEAQKQLIDSRLEGFLTQIVQTKLEITNPELLTWQIATQQVRVSEHRSLYCQAYELLRAGASQIERVEDFGLQILPAFQHQAPKELCHDIDNEFYLLSDAHYQRYIVANQPVAAEQR